MTWDKCARIRIADEIRTEIAAQQQHEVIKDNYN